MKKSLPFVMAILLAIAFSAFTPQKPQVLPTLYYHNGTGWVEIPDYDDACPEGEADQCEIDINGTPELLWKDHGVTPFKRQ